MRIFKCGKCAKPYKLEDEQIKGSVLTVVCAQCNAKNLLKFGVVLIATTASGSRSFLLKEGDNLIGRDNEDSISVKLDDKYVSRKHAIVCVEKMSSGFAVFIADCQSSNGTLNNKKLKLKPQLKYQFTENDYFVVGLTKLSIKHN